jgi:hypothetical protein
MLLMLLLLLLLLFYHLQQSWCSIALHICINCNATVAVPRFLCHGLQKKKQAKDFV